MYKSFRQQVPIRNYENVLLLNNLPLFRVFDAKLRLIGLSDGSSKIGG